MKYIVLIPVCLILLIACSANAQQKDKYTPVNVAIVSAHQESLYKQIMEQCLELISGPKEKKRDFDSFTKLFSANATIGTLAKNAELGTMEERKLTVEEFIDANRNFYAKNDFWELPKDYHFVESKEDTVMVEQLYEIYLADPNTAEPVVRGINTYTLVQHNGEWLIDEIFYKAYRDLNDLPDYFKHIYSDQE